MPLLKNADSAIIPVEKIRDYVLNGQHPVGRNKARVFLSATGMRRKDFANLIDQIKHGILVHDAYHYGWHEGRSLFRVDMPVNGPMGSARMRTGWIYEVDSDVPRLTTAYIIRP